MSKIVKVLKDPRLHTLVATIVALIVEWTSPSRAPRRRTRSR